MNAKTESYSWQLFFMGLLFFFVILMVLPVHAFAQHKGTIQPRTPQSENKKQVSKKPEKQKPEKRSLVPAGKQADITIFATGNVLGYIEPCG